MYTRFKTVILSTLLLSTLLTGSVFSATKEIDVSRGQIWIRGNTQLKLTDNFGAFAAAGSRYNYAFSKKINGIETDIESQDAWLQELWIGPVWFAYSSKKVNLTANLLYRPMFYYMDEKAGDAYVRHTFTSQYMLTINTKILTLRHRLMFWEQLAAEQGVTSFDNELIIRPLLGVKIPIYKNISFIVDEELYLKPTADDTDKDGTEFVMRNALWIGPSITFGNGWNITVQYVPTYIVNSHNKTLSSTVWDHYAYIDLSKSISFAKKKK